MLTLNSLTQIGTSRDDLIAFRVTGAITHDEMDALAEHLNGIFDAHDQVDLMIAFDRYAPAEAADTFDWEAMKSWFRAEARLRRYVIVGSAEHAQELIDGLSSILPVEAEIFDEEISAWRSLDAHAAPILDDAQSAKPQS